MMTSNPNPRTTPRGAQRAAQAKAKVDANAAKVAAMNEASDTAMDDLAASIVKGEVSFESAIVDLLSDAPRKRAPRKSAALTTAAAEKSSTKAAVARKGPSDADVKIAVAQLQAEMQSPAFAAAMSDVDAMLAATPAKSAAKKSTTSSVVAPAISKLADQLVDVEHEIKRTSDKDARKLVEAKRDALILKLIAAGAGYSYIAEKRGVAKSTNRGLCRVLEGGKRL